MLRDQKGIMEYLEFRQKLSQEIIYNIETFIVMTSLPGKKDTVSVPKKKYVSKRLLLLNFKKLYAAYKLKYPEHKTDFSKCASLHPKRCILVGPKGTHSFCVCTIHQNMKLMLIAIDLEKSYQEHIEMVCDRQSKIWW